MFKKENKDLLQVVGENLEQYSPIKKQVETLGHLSNTMETFIGNLIEEINESRTQMFDILENIAFYEANAKKKKVPKA